MMVSFLGEMPKKKLMVNGGKKNIEFWERERERER